MIDLWMVRHGETDWNTEGKVQGWTDIPLNDIGILQATRLSKWLPGIPFKTVMSSDLIRAKKTAMILNAEVGASFSVHSLLRERCFGSAEGMYRKDMLKTFPNGAPDAETEEAIVLRSRTFLTDISATYKTGRILCVSHGGFIRALLKGLGENLINGPQNTSVSRIRYEDDIWTPITINWTDHISTRDTETRPPVATSGRKQ